MATIYQVKIMLDADIADAYQVWLLDHIVGNPEKEILGMLELKTSEAVPIFQKAELYRSLPHGNSVALDVHYYLENEDMMRIYEQEFAPKMRTEVPPKFMGKFAINRFLFVTKTIGVQHETVEAFYGHVKDTIALKEVFFSPFER